MYVDNFNTPQLSLSIAFCSGSNETFAYSHEGNYALTAGNTKFSYYESNIEQQYLLATFTIVRETNEFCSHYLLLPHYQYNIVLMIPVEIIPL
jgi:hypothetical protein